MQNVCFQILENKPCKTTIPEKRKTNYMNSTIILVSCLKSICIVQGGDLKQSGITELKE